MTLRKAYLLIILLLVDQVSKIKTNFIFREEVEVFNWLKSCSSKMKEWLWEFKFWDVRYFNSFRIAARIGYWLWDSVKEEL
jgi:hypothetical protein